MKYQRLYDGSILIHKKDTQRRYSLSDAKAVIRESMREHGLSYSFRQLRELMIILTT